MTAAFALSAVLVAMPVSASAQLYDGFDELTTVFEGGSWWVQNHGEVAGNYDLSYEECGSDTCVVAQSDGETTYVRLEQGTDHTAGYYYNAELSELQTGFSYGTPTQWNPEVGSPVVLEARVRFSENYKPDGSGDAVGSAGIWMWNSPLDFNTGEFLPQDAYGFSWVTNQSLLLPGYTFNIVNDSYPVAAMPILNVDMNDWNTYTLEWGVFPSGIQYVKGKVNGQMKFFRPVLDPLSNLSREVWNDNQRVSMTETGEISISYDQTTSTQSMDVDYISLSK